MTKLDIVAIDRAHPAAMCTRQCLWRAKGRSGPLTKVPLDELKSSVVGVADPDEFTRPPVTHQPWMTKGDIIEDGTRFDVAFYTGFMNWPLRSKQIGIFKTLF